MAYKSRYQNSNDSPLPLWQQVYNLLDHKIFRLSEMAYKQANLLPNGRLRKIHVPYTLPQEAEDLLEILKTLGPDSTSEDCESASSFAISPAINQAIYGKTLY